MNQIKVKISKNAKRLAFIQIFLALCAIIVGVSIYNLILELLKIPQSVLDDPDALVNYLDATMSQYLPSMTIIMFTGFFIFILGIAYLVSILLLSSNFATLANIDPRVGQVAKSTSIFLIIGIILPIIGSLVLFIYPEITIFITLFMYLASTVIMTVGYFFICRTFKILHELGLFPKKESRLIFFGQLVFNLSFVPLSFTLTFVSLVPLIIAGVTALGGLTCVIVGFFRLSKDALLIKEMPVSATSMIQVQTGFKDPIFAPNTDYTQPQTQETIADTAALSEPGVSFCYNCGAKLFTKTQFCNNCGVEFDE